MFLYSITIIDLIALLSILQNRRVETKHRSQVPIVTNYGLVVL